jgi:hypothetical protein
MLSNVSGKSALYFRSKSLSAYTQGYEMKISPDVSTNSSTCSMFRTGMLRRDLLLCDCVLATCILGRYNTVVQRTTASKRTGTWTVHSDCRVGQLPDSAILLQFR